MANKYTKSQNVTSPKQHYGIINAHNIHHETVAVDGLQQSDEEIQAPEWIEWPDLEVLRNIVGVWLMGEIGLASRELMKVDLKMDENGANKKWRAHIQKAVPVRNIMTNIYGCGEWKILYPTSINVRNTIFDVCNYYMKYYHIESMILPRDLMNVIGDFILGHFVQFKSTDSNESRELIQMRLILTKQSFRTIKQAENRAGTRVGNDIGEDFSEIFGFSIENKMVDLMEYCINKVENKQDNVLSDNIMKLETFTNDEQDYYFDKYFAQNTDDF